MKDLYKKYLFNCYCQGDIWAETHRPYSYEEWVSLDMPDNGGIKI